MSPIPTLIKCQDKGLKVWLFPRTRLVSFSDTVLSLVKTESHLLREVIVTIRKSNLREFNQNDCLIDCQWWKYLIDNFLNPLQINCKYVEDTYTHYAVTALIKIRHIHRFKTILGKTSEKIAYFEDIALIRETTYPPSQIGHNNLRHFHQFQPTHPPPNIAMHWDMNHI